MLSSVAAQARATRIQRPGEDSQKKFALHLSSEDVRYWNVRPNGDVLGKYFETPLFTATTTLLSKKKVI